MRTNDSLTIATLGRLGGVRPRERPAGQQRYAEGSEVAGGHRVVVRVGRQLRLGLESLYHHVTGPTVAGEQPDERRGDAGHARLRGQRVLDPLEKGLRRPGRVAAELGRQTERNDVLGTDAEFDPADVAQALDEQSRRHQQRHGQGELGRHESVTETDRRPRPRRPAAIVLQRLDQLHARDAQGRVDSEEDAGRERQRPGEEHRRRLHRRRHAERHRRQERSEGAQGPLPDSQSDGAAQEGEQARFRQKLDDQVPPRRTNRQADRHLGRPRRQSRQQQVRDVGARDEHDGAGHREEQQQRRRDLLVQGALSPSPIADQERLGDELRPPTVAEARVQGRLHLGHDAPVQRRQRRSRLVHRDVRLEAGEQVRPVAPAVLEPAVARGQHAPHGDRHEDQRPQA